MVDVCVEVVVRMHLEVPDILASNIACRSYVHADVIVLHQCKRKLWAG